MARVVNIRGGRAYDVYVGRAGQGHDGYFGNPIRRGVTCTMCGEVHQEAGATVPCFERYARARLEVDREYRERVRDLYGRVLGCFCAPGAPCHGQVLVRLAAELTEEEAGGDNLAASIFAEMES